MTDAPRGGTIGADPEPATLDLEAAAGRRFALSQEVPTRFFEAAAPDIARACRAMAQRFQAGGRLLVFGEGAAASDARHVAVEFVHPVIVGKRALPAIALTDAVAGPARGGAEGPDRQFARLLGALGRTEDIALGLVHAGPGAAVAAGLVQASGRGLLTLRLAAASSAVQPGLDFDFRVPSDDPLLVQEVQETLYHVLWELVHVFL